MLACYPAKLNSTRKSDPSNPPPRPLRTSRTDRAIRQPRRPRTNVRPRLPAADRLTDIVPASIVPPHAGGGYRSLLGSIWFAWLSLPLCRLSAEAVIGDAGPHGYRFLQSGRPTVEAVIGGPGAFSPPCPDYTSQIRPDNPNSAYNAHFARLPI